MGGVVSGVKSLLVNHNSLRVCFLVLGPDMDCSDRILLDCPGSQDRVTPHKSPLGMVFGLCQFPDCT